MRKHFALLAFLLASTAAQAQYTFEYGGRTIRVDPDRGTVSIPGVYDNSGRKAKRSRDDQDTDRPRKQPPQQITTDPQAPAPGAAQTGQAPAPATASPEPSSATANMAPADAAPSAAPAAGTSAPVAATPAAPVPKPAASANSPLGLWLTEEREGRIRIEQCGVNLCGYSVDARSNQNAAQVLINMKPGKDAKWSGRILDPNSGSTYDSTIALKGPDSLRVQGCAFGGMFCGGQTWSRLN
jgi:uncharacterized protein (DUF2147 family)